MRTVSILIACMLLTRSAAAQRTYEAVVSGMRCTQQSSGQVDCDFRVGRSLHFSIAGVGQEDAAVTFYKVDWDGDYYASVGMLHGCVIVKAAHPTEADGPDIFAFVSPTTGRVYRDWPSCRAGVVG
jgi:hypothetical protein